MPYGFEPGAVYVRRRDIHAKFGGSQQPGIITTYRDEKRKLPGPIFIISGESGRSSGYEDEWIDGSFHYFGVGRFGNMEMATGNKAIRDASRDGRSILLFEEAPGGLQFFGELVYETHYVRRAPDAKGNERDAIVFVLRPIDAIAEAVENIPPGTGSIADLRRKAYEAAGVRVPKAGTKPRSVYERSADVRDYVLARAKGSCEGCGDEAPFRRKNGTPYLEPHHLTRISDGGPDHPKHVIALCPTCHRRVHYADNGKDYDATLLAKMPSIEAEYSV